MLAAAKRLRVTPWSTSAIRRRARARASGSAAESPAKPPPTIATSRTSPVDMTPP
jgi:hypothetical protein